MAAERLHAVLLAPAADGDDVGEAWSTCRWVASLAEHHEVTVLTYHKHGHRPLAEQLPGLSVVSWPDLPWVHRFERFHSMAKPGQAAFYWRARQWLRRERTRRRIDLVHQLAPMSLRHACPAAGLGIPYVLGPVGGSVAPAAAMAAELQAEPWYVRLRQLDRLRLQLPGRLRRSFRDAAHVLAVAPYVADLLPDVPRERLSIEAETGITELPPPRPARARAAGELRLLYVGRLVRSKGLYYGLQALARLPHLPQVTLEAIGDGPDRAAVESLVAECGLGDRVQLRGRLPRTEVEHAYQRADAFLFPSWREASGNVVFEAMRHSLPVITCRAGGPGHVVDDHSGVRVAADRPEQLVDDLARAILGLAAAPDTTAQLGRGARARVASLALWPAKAQRVASLWRTLVG